MEGSARTGDIRLIPTDLAVLELREPRKDLPCTLDPIQPILGFDLRHHSGYEVTVPLKELALSGGRLTILFRVTPENDKPSYFLQQVTVPAITEDARGNASLQGIFDVGEGKYHIDWLMRDQVERVCSAYWDVEVELPDKNRQIGFGPPPGVVDTTDVDQFKDEPPVMRLNGGKLLHVKILVNYAPQSPESSAMQPLDTAALVSVLRTISRDPHIGRFSLIAFNLQERRVVYRQDNADRIDFPALGQALESLNLGTVDVASLADRYGDTEFLEELVRSETAGRDYPDALVFVGPKAMLDENVPEEALAEVGRLDYPIFYLNCNLYPRRTPWRDAIGHVVRFFKGSEYIISRPLDVLSSVKDMVARTLTLKRPVRSPEPVPPVSQAR